MTTVQYRSTMSSTDAIIWNIERDPHLRSTVMAVWLLDEVPTPERIDANTQRMIAAIPRLRQRVEETRPRPTWVEVDDVDLDHHYAEVDLPPGSDIDDVLAFADRWVAEPFARDRPLWRLGLLRGLAGGRAAIVIKVHHAIADGMGMVLMLGAFTDLERHPAHQPADAVESSHEPREIFTPIHRVVTKFGRACRAGVRNPVVAARRFWQTIMSASRLIWPHRTPHSPLMTERSAERAMDVRTVPLEDMKAASKASDATINDTFVSILVDAIDRYHEASGAACDRLRVHIPVNSRTARTADYAGNDFVPARVSLDVERGLSHHDRTALVREQLTALREEPALHHVNTVSAAIQRLGRTISRWIIGGMMKGVDVLASNVPGPPFPLYIAGAKIDDFWPFGPPAGAAINVTMFSYDGTVRFGITTDTSAITDRETFLASLDAAIADALAPAAELATVAG